MAPMDDLLCREWKPPSEFDLAVHPQANRRRKRCSWGNRVPKITPRCVRKPRELTGPKDALAGRDRRPQSVEGKLFYDIRHRRVSVEMSDRVRYPGVDTESDHRTHHRRSHGQGPSPASP